MPLEHSSLQVTHWTSLAFYIVVLALSIKVSEGSFPCKKNEYIIRNGSQPCLKCNDCPDGYGLKPPCGSTIDHPPKIECFPCQPGTYSDSYDPSSCKPCHICSKHEIIKRKCTPDSNTICSGKCESGWYFENATHNCQPCSYCCGDENDIIIQDCKPSKKHCSIHNALKCSPTTVQTPTNITSIVTTSHAPVDGSKTNHVTKILLGIIGVLVAIIIIGILIYCYRKQRKGKCRDHRDLENDKQNQPLALCGFKKFNLNLEIKEMDRPYSTPLLLAEGRDLILTLADINVNGSECLDHCDFMWWKDDSKIDDYKERELKMNLKIENSGKYKCKLHCQIHQSEEKFSDEVVIHVRPVPPKRLKLLCEIGFEMEEQLANRLTSKQSGVGNWKNVGEHYGMKKHALHAIQEDDKRAEKVIDHLNVTHPNLTVFDFCEYLKTIRQIVIIEDLRDHLTLEEQMKTKEQSPNDTRDSGFEFDSFEYHDNSLQLVDLPPESGSPSVVGPEPLAHLKHNLSYCDSSREGSADESSDLPKKLNYDDQNSLQVDISPALNTATYVVKPTNSFVKLQNTNYSYSDSSREGSLDELPILRKPSKRNNQSDQSATNQAPAGTNEKRMRKRSFNRQFSKESQKSTDSGSLNRIKTVIKAPFNRRGSDYQEHRDTEDEEL